ncbi:MAG: efflux RND transporter periplasmic adaptor subunit [Desulfotomaculaceae bacterium]|nr:efflux RND transporter periplasmic adaptor subunit [Desulfotomaculaceae bacterium]
MKKGKKLFLGAGLVVILVAAAAAVALQSWGTAVETVEVTKGDITRTVVDTGYVQPVTDHELYATQTARVIRVAVKTGQAVAQGQTLVVLENLDLAVQIKETWRQISQGNAVAAAAKAARQRIELELRNAQDNFSRTQVLYQSGAVSLVEYDQAKLQVDTLSQSLAEQDSQIANSQALVGGLSQTLQQLNAKEKQLEVASPAAGTVQSLPAEVGQVLNPGSLLATVAAPDSLEIKADILSDDLSEVAEGQKVNITAPVLGDKTLTGRIVQIYPRAEEKISALGVSQRRVPVIIALEEVANLKPGFEVKVAIETVTLQNVLLVPLEALCTTAGGQKEAMVVVEGAVLRRVVTTGLSDREKVEITSGLAAGDVLVRDGSLNLADKAKVKPVTR